jgi:hypothetical protein
MPNLRQLVDGRCLEGELLAYGTSEGVKKAWDARGRVGAHQALQSKGWSRAGGKGAYHWYQNPKAAGRTMVLHSTGWQEQDDNRDGAVVKSGPATVSSLQNHLDTRDVPKYDWRTAKSDPKAGPAPGSGPWQKNLDKDLKDSWLGKKK